MENSAPVTPLLDPSSALFPKFQVIWQPLTFFLWCCERSHDICKEYVWFLKARILSEALEDTLLLKGRGGQGGVMGNAAPSPSFPLRLCTKPHLSLLLHWLLRLGQLAQGLGVHSKHLEEQTNKKDIKME